MIPQELHLRATEKINFGSIKVPDVPPTETINHSKKDEIRTSISAITNWELSVRGSNVGTRLDLNEAVAFAANGLVTAKTKTAPLAKINDIFDEMRAGRILGRMVLKLV